MLKKLAIAVILLGLVAAGGLGWSYQQVKSSLDMQAENQQEVLLTVRAGTSYRGLLNQLVREDLFAESPWTRWIPRLEPQLANLKSGTYQIDPAMSLKEVLALVASGREQQFAITLVEGERFVDWLAQLQQAPHVTHATEGIDRKSVV